MIPIDPTGDIRLLSRRSAFSRTGILPVLSGEDAAPGGKPEEMVSPSPDLAHDGLTGLSTPSHATHPLAR